ncbi:MAG: hypothetical protein AAFY03_03620, partial [Pseudomonadota bacterium]
MKPAHQIICFAYTSVFAGGIWLLTSALDQLALPLWMGCMLCLASVLISVFEVAATPQGDLPDLD